MTNVFTSTQSVSIRAIWFRASIVVSVLIILGSYSIVSAKSTAVMKRCLSEFGYGTCTDAATAPTGLTAAVNTSAKTVTFSWSDYVFVNETPTDHYMVEIAQPRGRTSSKAFARTLMTRGGVKNIMESYTNIEDTTKTISASLFTSKGPYFVRVIAISQDGETSRWSIFKQFQIKSVDKKNNDKKDSGKNKDKGRK